MLSYIFSLSVAEARLIADKHINFASEAEASESIKRAVKRYGASMVGIIRNNSLWNYTYMTNLTKAGEVRG